MPINPFNLQRSGYQEIPDNTGIVEDVTPLDGNEQIEHSSLGAIAKTAKSSMRATLVIAITCTIIALASFYGGYFSKQQKSTVLLFQTAEDSKDRMSLLNENEMSNRGFPMNFLGFGNSKCKHPFYFGNPIPSCFDTNNIARVNIDTSKTYQSIIGFGGAFTEASAYNFFKLPLKVQDRVIEMYFGNTGIGLSLGRIHINSCDFSLQSYDFDNVTGDIDLKYFDDNVTHDTYQIIPFIQRAMKKSRFPVKLLASPWSPPFWMKISNPDVKPTMSGSATPRGLSNDPAIERSWAKYISRFISAYKKHDVPIWALTPQNEPEFAAPWEACAYNASTELEFINNHLGPVMREEHPDLKIIAFDHNKDHLIHWTETMFGENDKGFVDGMAFHWYVGNVDRDLDGTYGYEAVNWASNRLPNDKILLATEACSCPGVLVDNWLRAERLAHDVIFDLVNNAQGWIDWNLLVDHKGGPNHLDNVCDASMFTLKDYSNIHIQPKYYYFGHISKFIRPGYIRVEAQVVGDYQYRDSVVNIKKGIEVQMFPCEKSVRQVWSFNSNSSLQLTRPALDGMFSHAASKYEVLLCIANQGSNERPYLRVDECSLSTSILRLLIQDNKTVKDSISGLCLEVVLGGLLDLKTCDSTNELQLFHLNEVTGELQQSNNGYCLTAGWPFLTGAAFQSDSKNETVVVLMNEATISTEIILYDTKMSSMRFGISGRGIQTIIY